MKRTEAAELRKYVGDLAAVCGITPVTFSDGFANGVRGYQLTNGKGIEMTVLADRGLDIPLMRFDGLNVGFYSKTGITKPELYQEDGAHGFLKRFTAGLLTSCGITYAGAACADEGQALGLHGPFSNTPAEQVCAEEVWDGDALKLRVAGQIREAEVFSKNMRLKRELVLDTESNVLTIEDSVTNFGFVDEPLMLVYHVNFGYPLLDDGAKVYTSARSVVPRDAIAAKNFDKWNLMEQPGVARPEECFFHTDSPDPKRAHAMLHNEKLGVAAILTYDQEAMPLMCEWKCMMAGDYALGLEPTTAGVMGRAAVRAEGKLPMLKPGETKTFRMKLELTRDEGRIAEYK